MRTNNSFPFVEANDWDSESELTGLQATQVNHGLKSAVLIL